MQEEKVNILVVDDLPDKLLAFRVVLDELDQNLVMVNSGAEALKELLEREFAVVLLDVNMPDIDGIETAELIRQHNKTKHTPIIFVTAYADEMQTARGYQLGAVDYILSPIVPEILRSKVRVFVELYRAQKRAQSLARAEAERSAAQEATQRADFLADASRDLGATLDFGEGARKLLEIAVPRLADAALLCTMLDTEQLLLACSLEDGRPSTRVVPSLHLLPAPLREAVEQAGTDRAVLDVPLWQDSERFVEWPQGLRSVRLLPVNAGDRVLGVLLLGTRRPSPAWSPADQAMIVELVGRAGMALENARLYWSLKREIAKTREAEEKLLEQSRRKDEFLAMLSHELRNPLAPIRNAVELLRRIAPADARLTWARDVVDRQVTHMAQLVDELLDVSRITQGKITLKKENVELEKVLALAIETARPLVDARGQAFDVRLPDTPVWIQGDFARLAQVVANLLNNAAKYTQEGGRIELVASAGSGEAVIVVRDNGMGIDPDLLPRVFELFSQGERSLDRALGGLGVGLTVVQRLVELHHGRVECTSDGPGRGAEFRVVLPCISEAHADATPRESTARVHRGEGQRVLVVDDNLDAAESIAVLLRLEGHEVKTVTTPQQALDCCQVFAPGAVVLDIGLPGMDGYELARQLRRLPGVHRDALFIALTGYGQLEDRAAAKSAGFHHHFIKPADPRAIYAVISENLRPGASRSA